jgi:hypothetical protein
VRQHSRRRGFAHSLRRVGLPIPRRPHGVDSRCPTHTHIHTDTARAALTHSCHTVQDS